MHWVFLGVVVWALGILFVLVLMQMAGREQDRAAGQEKEGISFPAEITTNAPIVNKTKGATVLELFAMGGKKTRQNRSPLERALDEIEIIVPPQKLNDMATILLRLIGELTPTEFMEIRSIVLTTCALDEAQRRTTQHQR